MDLLSNNLLSLKKISHQFYSKKAADTKYKSICNSHLFQIIAYVLLFYRGV